jgi:hypothetical protein
MTAAFRYVDTSNVKHIFKFDLDQDLVKIIDTFSALFILTLFADVEQIPNDVCDVFWKKE